MAWDYELFIDGAWTSDEAVGSIEVIDPATEGSIGTVPEAATKTPVRAIEAARRAFDEGPWPWMKPEERAAKLIRMAEILEARAGDLRELIIAETGSAGLMNDAIQGYGSIGMFRSNAAFVEHSFDWIQNGPPSGGSDGHSGSAIVREPIGVVAAITPFNFPFMLNVVKVAPALAAGCTVVLKPHPWTPLDAMMIAEAAEEADIPPGVLNVITGHGEVGDELTTQPHGRHGHVHGLDGDRPADHGVGRRHREEGPARARWQERPGRARRRQRGATPASIGFGAGPDALRAGVRAPDPGAAARAPPPRLQGGGRGDRGRSSRSATRATTPTSSDR